MADDNNNDDGVFIYTEGVIVPHDVVRVRVHPSVTVIFEQAFYKRENLVEVELCEGLFRDWKASLHVLHCVDKHPRSNNFETNW